METFLRHSVVVQYAKNCVNRFWTEFRMNDESQAEKPFDGLLLQNKPSADVTCFFLEKQTSD